MASSAYVATAVPYCCKLFIELAPETSPMVIVMVVTFLLLQAIAGSEPSDLGS